MIVATPNTNLAVDTATEASRSMMSVNSEIAGLSTNSNVPQYIRYSDSTLVLGDPWIFSVPQLVRDLMEGQSFSEPMPGLGIKLPSI